MTMIHLIISLHFLICHQINVFLDYQLAFFNQLLVISDYQDLGYYQVSIYRILRQAHFSSCLDQLRPCSQTSEEARISLIPEQFTPLEHLELHPRLHYQQVSGQYVIFQDL